MLANPSTYATLVGRLTAGVGKMTVDRAKLTSTIGTLGCALLVAAAAGCGSVSASSAVSDATRDLREAEAQKAPEFAVYYYARAESYLAKAKECNGMGQFQVATEYARTSQGASEKALEVARSGRDQASRREKFAPKNGEREKQPTVPDEK